jgi:chemotaxis protein CheZ
MAEDFKHNERVLQSARSLVEELEAGNGERVEELLEELSSMRESSLFTEMGKLTRELHDSLRNFELDSRISELAEEEIPDAKERLNHVITMTEQAANKTMDAVEVSIPLAENIRQRSDDLFEKWQRFRNRDLSVEEFRELSKELDRFFSDVSSDSKSLNSSLSDVLMAQDFQDITGQIIRQVISLVQDVEEGLVDLIRISTPGRQQAVPAAKDVKPDSGPDIAAEGPQIPSKKSDNYVQGQDDVDDLLSSLGF